MTLDWPVLLTHILHDVRSLARKGLSNAQLLERELGENLAPDVQGRLAAILASQHDLNRLMASLGKLSEAISFDRESLREDCLDIDTILLGAKLEQKSALAEAKAEFLVNAMPECSVPSKLQAVFSELIRNAVQFRAARPLVIVIAADQPSRDWLRVQVSDNGRGWDPAHTPKLFAPFQRLHTDKSGFGLGLFIARAIVENACGRISCSTDPDGAQFVVEIPLAVA